MVPSLLLQPLVEKRDPARDQSACRRGYVSSDARRLGDKLSITILDDGIGCARAEIARALAGELNGMC